MKKDDHYALGSLLKTSGIKGEIILKFTNDCPEEIQKLESIFIDIDNKLVPFFIEGIRPKSSNAATVKLEGLDDEFRSSEFIGAEFYVSYDQANELQIESNEYIDVVGYSVFNQNNKLIGKVLEFLDIPENPLVNIQSEKGEILIPVKDELIIEINDRAKEIHLTIVEGLLDMD